MSIKKIDKNIPIPLKHVGIPDAEKNLIKEMEIGDSFIIDRYAVINRYRNYARAIGKELLARKNFTGTHKSDFNYRVWYSKKIKPYTEISPSRDTKLKKHGMLSKKEVQDGAKVDPVIYAQIDSHVLAIAELQEENKKIVDDMEHIKKVMREELGHVDWNYKTTSFKSWIN